MLAKVQKWGNSLAVRLPRKMAEEAGVDRDVAVELTLRGEEIVIRPLREKARFDLDELLARVRPDNLHDEIDSGAARGKEAW